MDFVQTGKQSPAQSRQEQINTVRIISVAALQDNWRILFSIRAEGSLTLQEQAIFKHFDITSAICLKRLHLTPQC